MATRGPVVTRPHENIQSFSAVGESGVDSWLIPLVVTLDSHLYQLEVDCESYTIDHPWLCFYQQVLLAG